MIDLSAIKKFGADREFATRIARTSLTEVAELLVDLEAAIAAAEYGEIHRLAHTLKGVLRLYGDHDARNTAYQLEQSANRQDLDNIPKLFAELKPMVEEFQKELTELVNG